MVSRRRSRASRGRPRTFIAKSGTNLSTIGRWYSPPANPPVILETKWRFCRLKFGVAAAGDSGAIENYTPVRIFEGLKAQQGIDVTAALSTCRILRISSYALQGVADSGGQTYPSTKIRAFAPTEDTNQGVLLEQREDGGTLQSVARIGYRYPKHLQQKVMGGSSTLYFCQIENYHCARGYVYIDCMWATNPN